MKQLSTTYATMFAMVFALASACDAVDGARTDELVSDASTRAIVANSTPFYGYWYADSPGDGSGIHYNEVADFSSILHLNVGSFPTYASDGTVLRPWDTLDFSALIAHIDDVQASRPMLRLVIDISGLFCNYDNSGNRWSNNLMTLKNALGARALSIRAIYVFDEPDLSKVGGCAFHPDPWTSSELDTAIGAVEAAFSETIPTMATYSYNDPTTYVPIAAKLDIVAIDSYPTSLGRSAFDSNFVNNIYRLKRQQREQGLNQPIVIVGRSFDNGMDPTRLQWWYHELWRDDPQVLGLWWFRYTDASQIATLTSIHEQVWNSVLGRNRLANSGFEQMSIGWNVSGSPSIVDTRLQSKNAIVNPGFESAPAPSDWVQFGAPSSARSTIAHTGNYAAMSAGQGAGFVQTITCMQLFGTTTCPEVELVLRQWMRGVSGGEIGRLQINWYSNQGPPQPSIMIPRLDTTYREFTMHAMIPSNVTRLEVYVSSHSDLDRILVDDMHLSTAEDDLFVHGDARSAAVTASKVFYQRVPVNQGEHCTLWQFVRRGRNAGTTAQTSRLQVNWLNSAGTTIGTSLPPACDGNASCVGTISLPADNTYTQGRLELIVPTSAKFAEVYASSNQSNGEMLIDDMTFVCH